jgi:1-acyl-sn-glycerol-3-phosphate acyltransferase
MRLLPALRLACRSAGLLLILVVLVPPQILVLAVTRGPASMRLPMLIHRLACRLLGLRVELSGAPATDAGTLFVSNHLSYLDVLAIGSVVRACFVAKQDVRHWPLLGPLARLQHTVFVSRDPRQVGDVTAALARELAAGRRLVLFPEGTTSDGSGVLVFKSSAFAVAANPLRPRVRVQPFTIVLLAVDGVAIASGGDRDRYAYHGEMRLLPHLAAFMRGSGAQVRLQFHAPLAIVDGQGRKELAAQAHACVLQGMQGRGQASIAAGVEG